MTTITLYDACDLVVLTLRVALTRSELNNNSYHLLLFFHPQQHFKLESNALFSSQYEYRYSREING